jgi:predicted permease
VGEFWRRLQALARRKSLEHDLDEELQFHLDMKAREMGDRAAAMRALGNPVLLRERAREAWGWSWLDGLGWDIRHALRQFRRNPGFASIAIAVLALGIGVNGAVFTLTNTVLFSGTPNVDPTNRVVYIATAQGVSYPDFEDWRTSARSFAGQVGVVFIGGYRTRLDDHRGPSQMYDATQLSANAFQVLNRTPILGRDFLPSDQIPGAPPVTILSHELWERRYGSDPGIVGQTIGINSTPASWGSVDLLTSTPTTVIGVMPPQLRFPHYRVDLWLPLVQTAGMLIPDFHDRQRRNFYFAFGRLADGISLQQARTEMEAIGHRLERDYPLTNRGVVPLVKSFHEFFVGEYAVALYASMLVAVAFVLLIACANLANLMLAKGIGQAREITVRIALGAGRWRIARQLLIESLMLSIIGGLLGGVLAVWSIRAYNLLANDPYAYWRWDYAVDYRVLAYLVAVSLGTGLLFGCVPAARFSRLDINSGLKNGSRGTFGRRAANASTLLVIGQVILAVVLLAGAGVMIRTVLTIATSDLGVKTDRVLAALVAFPKGKYPTAESRMSVVRRLREQLRSLPDVESVAITSRLPAGVVFGGGKSAYQFREDVSPDDVRGRTAVTTVAISEEYFETLSAGVRRGRAFTEADGATGEPVAIVNQRLASTAWPGQDPIGRRMRALGAATSAPSWLTVVGVASNIVQDDRTGQQFEPAVYRPYQQMPESTTTLWVLARTGVPPARVVPTFRREIQAVDDLLVGPGNSAIVSPLVDLLVNNYRSRSVNGGLFLLFATIAFLLASIGLYAVVAHSVSQRTQEIGLRTAIGATRQHIVSLVMKEGMVPVGIGLLMGIPAAFAVMPALRSQLVNVSPIDPTTLVAVAIALILSATLGCLIPARRALRVDPAVALKHE